METIITLDEMRNQLETANQRIFRTFPTIQRFDDGSPFCGGYSNTTDELYILLEGGTQIDLHSSAFYNISGLWWDDYLDLVDDLGLNN
jgi:hypothetical protein